MILFAGPGEDGGVCRFPWHRVPAFPSGPIAAPFPVAAIGSVATTAGDPARNERRWRKEHTYAKKKKILARLADAADRKQRVSPLDTHKKWPTLRLDFEVTKRDKFQVCKATCDPLL